MLLSFYNLSTAFELSILVESFFRYRLRLAVYLFDRILSSFLSFSSRIIKFYSSAAPQKKKKKKRFLQIETYFNSNYLSHNILFLTSRRTFIVESFILQVSNLRIDSRYIDWFFSPFFQFVTIDTINKVFIALSFAFRKFRQSSKFVLSNFICDKKRKKKLSRRRNFLLRPVWESSNWSSFETEFSDQQTIKQTLSSSRTKPRKIDSIRIDEKRNDSRFQSGKEGKKNEVASLEIKESIAKRWSDV